AINTPLSTALTNAKARANHTGTQLASTISDFQAKVSENTDVAAMKAIIGDGVSDGDALVDTLAEMLTTFQTYAEGVDIATQLAAKLAKASNLSDLPNAATARTNLGLGNVDNTSDANKPISTAVQAALNTKVGTVLS